MASQAAAERPASSELRGAPPGARRAGCHRPSGGKPPALSPESGRGWSGAWLARAGSCQALAPPGRPSVRRRKPHRTRACPRAREGTAAPQRRRSRSCGRRQPARERRLTTCFGGGPCRASLSMARTEQPGARGVSAVEAVARLAASPQSGWSGRAFSPGGGGEGLAPPSPWSVQRRGLGVNGAIRRCPSGFFRARGRSPVRLRAVQAQGPRRPPPGLAGKARPLVAVWPFRSALFSACF